MRDPPPKKRFSTLRILHMHISQPISTKRRLYSVTKARMCDQNQQALAARLHHPTLCHTGSFHKLVLNSTTVEI
jgi:hypothetical protein